MLRVCGGCWVAVGCGTTGVRPHYLADTRRPKRDTRSMGASQRRFAAEIAGLDPVWAFLAFVFGTDNEAGPPGPTPDRHPGAGREARRSSAETARGQRGSSVETPRGHPGVDSGGEAWDPRPIGPEIGRGQHADGAEIGWEEVGKRGANRSGRGRETGQKSVGQRGGNRSGAA